MALVFCQAGIPDLGLLLLRARTRLDPAPESFPLHQLSMPGSLSSCRIPAPQMHTISKLAWPIQAQAFPHVPAFYLSESQSRTPRMAKPERIFIITCQLSGSPEKVEAQ
jgi:hypothetical protein